MEIKLPTFFKKMSSLNLSSCCFLCHQNIESSVSSQADPPNSSNARKCHRFLVLVSRYLHLNTDFVDVGMTLNMKVKEGCDDWRLCEDCFPELDAFCDLYDLLQHLHMEINRKLGGISEIIRRSAMGNQDGITINFFQTQTIMPEDFKISLLKQGK